MGSGWAEDKTFSYPGLTLRRSPAGVVAPGCSLAEFFPRAGCGMCRVTTCSHKIAVKREPKELKTNRKSTKEPKRKNLEPLHSIGGTFSSTIPVDPSSPGGSILNYTRPIAAAHSPTVEEFLRLNFDDLDSDFVVSLLRDLLLTAPTTSVVRPRVHLLHPDRRQALDLHTVSRWCRSLDLLS